MEVRMKSKQSTDRSLFQSKPTISPGSFTPTILVVDDEDHILKLYQKELTEEGFQVKTATRGEEALSIAQRESPDLVVLDIKLKDQNGLEILGSLRKLNKNIPIILNSAYSTYKNDFQSWLADAYLVKSPNMDDLKKKIRELINI
jgi:two-component system response regulator (stage 0 sporulation protein F)